MRTSENYEGYTVVLASGYLLCFITRYLDHIYIKQASSFYYTSRNPVLKGIYFENYFHSYILRTMKDGDIVLKCKYKLVGKEFQLENFF
jgi:hypothetical protein